MAKGVSLALTAAALLVALPPCFAQRNLLVEKPPAAEQRLALVIGNARYADAALRNPGNDAADMAAALREVGFQVLLRTDATQREMKQAIREFGEKLAAGGVGLFYFAGHGVQSNGRNYLIPVGAQIQRPSDIEDETVDMNFVLAQMEDARNRLNLVILDACRNNPYQRGFRSATRGLAQMDATSGTLIAFATAPGSVAADGDGRNGVYTRHLLRQMRAPGVPVELMLKRVRDGVMQETKDRQVPWESSSLRGADFSFRYAAVQPSVPDTTLSPQSPEGAKLLREAMAAVERGNALLLQGKERDADVEYRPAYATLRKFRLEDLDDEQKVALGRFFSRLGGNYDRALSILVPLARKGYPMAQHTAGVLLRDSKGDDKAGLEWLRKATDQGNPFSQTALGYMYQLGNGVPQDYAEAVRLYQLAAAQGYPSAQNNLGLMHRDGRGGLRKDRAEAERWFEKAAAQGHERAQINLARLRDGRR